MLIEGKGKKQTKKSKKEEKNKGQEFLNEENEKAFKVEYNIKKNQLHYKVCWLDYNMAHNIWVTKKEIVENVPEDLAIY